MSNYLEIIKRVTSCADSEAVQIEDVMRDVIFRSNLDWQSREELEEAALLGYKVIRHRANENGTLRKGI